MKANTLRIGNLILGQYFDYDDPDQEEDQKYEVCEVVTLDSPGSSKYPIWVNGLENTQIEVYCGFEGIPLTEEWLLKFEKIEWISKDIDGIFYWFNGEKKYLKFIHSLQNTYFCIEQKELLCVNT